jgi:hypothetical protein
VRGSGQERRDRKGKGRGLRKGGEMTQTLYANINSKTKI